MSRVFEELTAAVYEQQNRRNRELNDTAVERDLVVRFHRVRQTEPAFTEIFSSPDTSTTKEETSKTNESETKADSAKIPVNEHEQNSEDRHFHFKRAWVAALLAAVVSIMAYLAMPGGYTIQQRANSGDTTYSRQQNGLANEITNDPGFKTSDTRPVKAELSRTAATDARQVAAEMDLIAPPVQSEKPNKTWSVQVPRKLQRKLRINSRNS